jgi:hypothetical protein
MKSPKLSASSTRSQGSTAKAVSSSQSHQLSAISD